MATGHYLPHPFPIRQEACYFLQDLSPPIYGPQATEDLG